MEFINVFAAAFVGNYPTIANLLFFCAIVACFIFAPVAVFVVLKARHNQGRYQFEKKLYKTDQSTSEHLYLLDTMKGELFFVEGNYNYKRMVIYDRDPDAPKPPGFWKKHFSKK